MTIDLAGEERPFPIDVVPRVIAAAEWAGVERGVRQRVRVLEAFLADVYGPMRVVADRVVPRHVITSSSHFHREATGVEPANGVRVHVSGIDLVRDEQGRFRVLEDNVRVPSGVSYVLENRRAMTQALPGLFASMRVRPMSDYPERLLAALQLSEAWAQGRGVCQDFAHIALGALRGLGVPARYVSGYLHPDATAGVGGTVTGQSHAWVQWWVGEWFAFDPTNDRPAGLDHVVVATGRDYGDVSPFRGVISGGAGSRMTVEVQLTRER